ncbi:uncharacterized protein LOC135224540 isoform X1 [Macrobrachium nipponense]|uniref:uncharacterized protein LOC135224540 isoform X1 n=1 Tax=Macrobrachium nipponense TaxID=159736 RepID=UPI0030C7F4E3
MKCYIGTCLILSAVLIIGSALKCYKCDGSCTIVDCEGSCMNITTTQGNNLLTQQRDCWPTKEENKCSKSEIRGIFMHTCYCNTNECNAGSAASLFKLLLVVPFIIQSVLFL